MCIVYIGSVMSNSDEYLRGFNKKWKYRVIGKNETKLWGQHLPAWSIILTQGYSYGTFVTPKYRLGHILIFSRIINDDN